MGNPLCRLDLLDRGRQYEVQPGDTWCLLAYREYGTPHLWWVIASAANTTNPTGDPVPGAVVRVPSYSDALKVVKTQ